MPALACEPAAPHTSQPAQAALTRLAGELATHGLQSDLNAPHAPMPYLIVRNPNASIMTETVYTKDGFYWWSWQEKIAPCDNPAATATILARVLRTVATE